MWQIMINSQRPVDTWINIFGEAGSRGEYMDGYSEQSMEERCRQDYNWENIFSLDAFASERAAMMSHLYGNEQLWEHVCMVAFAEHYVFGNDGNLTSKPYHMFMRQKHTRPIFGGVVFQNWQSCNDDGIERKLSAFKEKGIDYVRLECNLGSADDIGGPAQLTDNPLFHERFDRLAKAAKDCQNQGMVPLVLLQMPWREPDDSYQYFDKAVKAFAGALKNARVEPKRLLFETRPPIGMSAREETGLKSTTRTLLGLEIGQKMFSTIDQAFDGDTIAGFCVAGGSTKGDDPTAMQDDTQNAVRQGMRQCAKRQWGYDLCFWEMGAKLMLQPKVGQLWKNNQSGRDAARELFLVNAEDMADEIKAEIVNS